VFKVRLNKIHVIYMGYVRNAWSFGMQTLIRLSPMAVFVSYRGIQGMLITYSI